MKKRLFLFPGSLCSLGFYSCQKNIEDSNQDESASQNNKLLFMTAGG
jgi:hypothetical protein